MLFMQLSCQHQAEKTKQCRPQFESSEVQHSGYGSVVLFCNSLSRNPAQDTGLTKLSLPMFKSQEWCQIQPQPFSVETLLSKMADGVP